MNEGHVSATSRASALLTLMARSDILRRAYAACRQVPILGALLHKGVDRFLPQGSRIWIRIPLPSGEGPWILADPRYDPDYFTGRHESWVQEQLWQHLRAGDCFYDIGAHIGFFALIAAQIVGERGHVAAFEPELQNAVVLRANIERNRMPQISLVEAAVWSSSGQLVFERANPASSLMQGHAAGRVAASAKDGGRIVVPSVALDDFVRTAPPPHFIKCDVEGAEVEIFRAAKRVLGHYKPTVVCETHSPQSAQALEELFRGFGYVLKDLDGNHLLALPT